MVRSIVLTYQHSLELSSTRMDRTVLRLTLPAIQAGDEHLPEMQRYIRYLVGFPDKGAAAHNASLAYLAI
jgi:hypothetical protein